MLDIQRQTNKPPITRDMKVAFVYPPFGPPNLANLGIAILAAGLEQRGFETRTFYWNYRLLDHIPAETLAQKRQIYTLFTQRDLFPWNEWAFTRHVFGDQMDRLAPKIAEGLARLDQEKKAATAPYLPSRLVGAVSDAVPQLLTEMGRDLEPYDMIGITSTFYQNGASLALAKYLKEQFPEKITVMGGANCDGEMGQAIMELFPFVDYVFSGEVDLAFPDFVDKLERKKSVSKVQGLIQRKAGQVVVGPAAKPLDNMDTLPTPTYEDFIAERQLYGLFESDTLVLPLESSRGCWWGAKHHCVFCGLNANGMAYRQKSEQRFRDEVREVTQKYDVKYLFMADNILSARYYRDFIQWAKNNEIDINYFYEIKSNVNRAQVADLADAGVTMVQPGIESFATPILKQMRKGVRGIQNIAFLKYTADFGVIPAWNILAGFPGEEPAAYETMAKQVPHLTHFAPPNGVVDIEFHRFSPYHNDPDSFGIKLRPHQNYFIIYPLEEAQVARLAYVFEVEGRTPMSLSYLSNLNTAIFSWMKAFRENRSTLTWARDDAGAILVQDRRADMTKLDYRLTGFASEVYLALDAPVTLSAVARDPDRFSERAALATKGPGASKRVTEAADNSFPIVAVPAPVIELSFTRAEFEADPEAAIAPLIEAGIIYKEDELFVTLPLADTSRHINGGWRKLGI
ncbi:MAG: RiPP maturation radical SAM C-methyltransferase [Litoreibacter sp.]